jgi:hypothetical protein
MKNPNVFELIKSLNMSEKRQFKIYSSRHIIEGENKYILLFDELDKMEVYNQEILTSELKQKNKNTLFIKADMNFLYQLILKSLVLFHSGKSAHIILNEMISIIEILYYKGNFVLCMKEITKAASIAKNTESYSALTRILQYEKIVCSHLQKHSRNEKEIISELVYTNTTEQNIIELYDLFNQANLIRIKIIKTRNIKEINAFDKLMKHPLLQDIKLCLCTEARIKFYQIHAMYCYIKSDKKQELVYNKKIIDIFDKHIFYKDEHLVDYVNTYAHIISIIKAHNEKIFIQELNNVRNIKIQSEKLYFKRVSAQIFNFTYMIELSMYLQKKQFLKAAGIITEIENGLKKYKEILIPSYKITFLYMLAYYYFATGNFDQAGKRINQILNDYSENERPDLYNFAKLLNLLIHFELKNFTYIRYKQSSVHNYFKKQSSEFETENMILKFFSREKHYTTDAVKSFQDLKLNLQNIKSHSLEKYAFNYFDWIDWIDSKIKRKSAIADLYK